MTGSYSWTDGSGIFWESVYFFEGTGNGSVMDGVPLQDSDGNIIEGTGRFTGPAVTDLNDDGLLDLMLGCSVDGFGDGEDGTGYDDPGPLHLYINVGTADDPIFENRGYVTDVNGDEIRYVYNRVVIADMDNDGLKDLVCSSTVDSGPLPDALVDSEVLLHRNIGTAAEPIYDEMEILGHIDGSALLSDYAVRLGVTDYDGDGVQDLLYNTSHHYPGRIALLRGQLP